MTVRSEGIHNPGTDMMPEDFIKKARRLLTRHVDNELDKTRRNGEVLPEYEVQVVMFAYILGGWKAEMATNMPDGRYYELTYNAAKQETYIDQYVKELNVVVPD